MFDFILWIVAFLPGAFAQQTTHFDPSGLEGLLYEKRGNISITGVFGRRFGDECDGEVERGLEEIISAIWTTEALNMYQYLPGITIGLSVFDVCESLKSESKLFKMAEELLRFDEEAVNVGIIATPEISKKLTASETISDRNIVHIKHIVSGDLLADITVQLLLNLQWMNITALVADSENGMNSFRSKAAEEGIFVQNSVLMDCGNPCLEDKFKTPSVIVVVASFDNITRLSGKFHKKKTKLILTPTDFVFDSSLLDLPRNAIVCLPSMQDKRVLSGILNNIQGRREFFSRKPPIKGPLFLGTAATIITFLKPLRTALEESCRNENGSKEPCVPAADFIDEIKGNKTGLLSHKTMEISPDDVEEALKVLKIEPSYNDEMFLYIASVINANASEDFAIFQIFNLELRTFQSAPIMINDDSLSISAQEEYGYRNYGNMLESSVRSFSASMLQEVSTSSEKDLRPLGGGTPSDRGCDHQGGHCRNLEGNLTAPMTTSNGTGNGAPLISWRFITWVSVNTTLALVGVTCTLSIILFVVIKICKDDFLEGSPYFMLLLMISVILTYVSSFPFHVELLEEEFLCGYRKHAPPMVFALLFSLLLSRSLMIAFSEAGGGLPGHVNGYLQFILGIFMISVQASITLQNWFMEKGVQDLTCSDLYDKYNIVFILAYDVLLLILLACVSPFIVRSKLNCKEGLLLSIGAFLITIVWSGWISFYVLLPRDHKDAAVAVGLNLTASVLLVSVFIPQMYFMSSPFSQDQTMRSLSVLNRSALTGCSHADYKSSHNLNDCAFGSYKNCDMGCVNPSFLPGRPNGSNTLGETDNFVGEAVLDMTPETSQAN